MSMESFELHEWEQASNEKTDKKNYEIKSVIQTEDRDKQMKKINTRKMKAIENFIIQKKGKT